MARRNHPDDAKGQHRALRLFSELHASTENSSKRWHEEYFDKALTYKSKWDKALECGKQAGITSLPDPRPRSDQIVLDMTAGTVPMTGPLIREERTQIDGWKVHKLEIRDAVNDLKINLKGEAYFKEQASIQEHI